MKLWLIIMLWGEIGAFAGPVPNNDMVLCVQEADKMLAQIEEGMDAAGGSIFLNGLRLTMDDVVISCQVRSERPEIGGR
jgi:hypothetical protein